MTYSDNNMLVYCSAAYLSVCAGVSLLEDKDLSSALCVCCGNRQDPCPPIDARFTEWLLEPQTAEIFVMENVLQVDRCVSKGCTTLSYQLVPELLHATEHMQLPGVP